MNRVLILLIGLLVFVSCSKSKKDYDPLKEFSFSKRDSVLTDIIALTEEHYPDSIKKEERSFPKNRPFYLWLSQQCDFDYLYKNSDGLYYYMVRKPARGIPDLFVGIGGKFKKNEKNEITEFEETFRLWRMPANDLDQKGFEVFQDFSQNKDLKAYQTKEKYIEFPNEHVAYDKPKQEWVIVKPY